MKRTRVSTVINDYIIMTFGLLMYSVAWTVFLIPNHLVGGGVSGISAIIQYTAGIPMSYSYFLINILLLAVALKVLGPSFGVKTVVAIVLASIFLRIEPMFLTQDFLNDVAIGNGKLLCSLIGGVLSGIGIGLCFSRGGSTGGTDIVALIANKYYHIPPGKVILFCDVFIVGSSIFLGEGSETITLGHRIANVIYGYVLVACTSFSLDLFLNGIRQSQQFFIFSRKYDEIAARISEEVHRGVTLVDSQGWYSKAEGKIILVICRKTEANQIFRLIKEIDKEAFVSVSQVTGVYGQGFDTIRVKK